MVTIRPFDSAAQRAARKLAPAFPAADFDFIKEPRFPKEGFELKGRFPSDQYGDYGHRLGAKLVELLAFDFPDLQQQPGTHSSGETSQGSPLGLLRVASKDHPTQLAEIGLKRTPSGFEVTYVTPKVRTTGKGGKTTEASLYESRGTVYFTTRSGEGRDFFDVSGTYCLSDGQPAEVLSLMASLGNSRKTRRWFDYEFRGRAADGW
jgi:hypothetical protein